MEDYLQTKPIVFTELHDLYKMLQKYRIYFQGQSFQQFKPVCHLIQLFLSLSDFLKNKSEQEIPMAIGWFLIESKFTKKMVTNGIKLFPGVTKEEVVRDREMVKKWLLKYVNQIA